MKRNAEKNKIRYFDTRKHTTLRQNIYKNLLFSKLSQFQQISLGTIVMPTYDISRPSQEAILRLESWYHGLLTRLRSECLVRSEGDFLISFKRDLSLWLVRDSISLKDDFVLTVFWNGHAVHFQINKGTSSFSSSGFFFSKEQFENIPDLVTFYQAHNKTNHSDYRPLPKPVRSPIKEDQNEYTEIDYDAMEKTTVAALTVPEVVSPSTSKLCYLQDHKLSLTSLNSVCSELTASSSALSPGTSASCLEISNLHWHMPRSDSFPVLPKRKVSLPTRDRGYVPGNPDYDRSRACAAMSVINLHNYQSPFIKPNNKPQTEELLEKFRQLLLMKKPESCAQLITAEDYRLLRLGKDLQLNGLLLILLPHGENVRNDLLERQRSLHYLCILSILPKAQSTQRCTVYNAWVQIARALFYQCGNAFSFLMLLDALCSDLVKSVVSKEYSWTLQQELELVAYRLHRCEPLPLSYPQINMQFINVLDNLWKWLQEGRHWVKRANFLSTEFSLKVLLGSKGLPMNTEKRYDKLAAMTQALKERCSLHRCSFHRLFAGHRLKLTN
uniref:SH2 domain-containing protein n=1 Tax=Wuchereria bancrofti TaxID=6293 RepID=A0AAF5PJA3_WUCBA